jgi:hypothetical protein
MDMVMLLIFILIFQIIANYLYKTFNEWGLKTASTGQDIRHLRKKHFILEYYFCQKWSCFVEFILSLHYLTRISFIMNSKKIYLHATWESLWNRKMIS